MGLEVIGAGFGRTGTLSLKAALEQLGFQKCHHMMEVFKDPVQIDHWHAVSRGEPVDWNRVFDGYRASCDFPSSVYWEELHRHFPDSKVVLTVRDPDKGYRSVSDTIYPLSLEIPGWLKLLIPRLRKGDEMVMGIVWNGLFGGRFSDREHALRVFREHAERVQQRVGSDRLLVFEPKDGWEPLCRFLGVPVPDGPFPHLNEAASMRRLRRVLAGLRWLPWLLPVAAVAALFLS
ncbi:MAG: sulfotransferase family protein [Proteobacteria bacterium]|nr:sulfotransferase family protein [Pseudomonadota bacterium]